MDEALRAEYEKLSEEILERNRRRFQVLAATFTFSSALIGYGLTSGKAVVFLVPLAVLAQGQMLILHAYQATRAAAAYVRCFLEMRDEALKYETRLHQAASQRAPVYRSLEYMSNFWSVQFLGLTCVGLALGYGTDPERLGTILAFIGWLAFSGWAGRKYQYLRRAGPAEQAYFDQWKAIARAEREGGQGAEGRPPGMTTCA
jgi:hypothetical protein